MTKKRMIPVSLDITNEFDTNLSLDKFKAQIESLIVTYGGNANIDITVTGYDGHIEVEIFYEREETDTERDARVKTARYDLERKKKQKKDVEDKERALLAELKAKYE